jgi:hypothetical protein
MGDSGVVERQKNLLQIEALASEAITTAVRGLLPVKQILHDYLGEDEGEEDTEVIEGSVTSAAPLLPSLPLSAPSAPSSPSPSLPSESPDATATTTKVVGGSKEEGSEGKEEVKEEGSSSSSSSSRSSSSTSEAKVVDISSGPAVVSIDTEPTVHFSSYDDVFDESKGEPHIQYNPKDGDDDDNDEVSDAITVDESTTRAIDDADIEDLDAPEIKKVVPKKAIKEVIDDEEVVVLE